MPDATVSTGSPPESSSTPRPDPLTRSSVLRVKRGWLLEPFDDGALMLQAKERFWVGLNSTARDAIELTDGLKTVEEISALVAPRYGVSPAGVMADLLMLFTEMQSRGIVAHARAPDGAAGGEFDQRIYAPSPGVALREAGDSGGILSDGKTRETFTLNTTGAAIWSLLDGARTMAEVIAAVAAMLDGTPGETLADDIEEYIQVLEEVGAITRCS